MQDLSLTRSNVNALLIEIIFHILYYMNKLQALIEQALYETNE